MKLSQFILLSLSTCASSAVSAFSFSTIPDTRTKIFKNVFLHITAGRNSFLRAKSFSNRAPRAAVACRATPVLEQDTVGGDEPNPPKWPDSVIVINAGMDSNEIIKKTQKTSDNYDALATNPENNESGIYGAAHHFVEDRFAVLFEPGTYDVDLEVGYYTQVAGLGETPEDVLFEGTNTAYGPYCPALRKDEMIAGRPGTSLDTFWRVAENYATNATNGQLWAVSQAAPIRRVHVYGNLTLHDAGAQASGGHMANCLVDDKVIFGSQQQFCCRSVKMAQLNADGDMGAWSNVFVDCIGPPTESSLVKQTKDGTNRIVAVTVDKAPKVTVEKPFVSMNTELNKYFLHVPQPRFRPKDEALGPDLTGETDVKRDFSRVFVARAKTPDGKVDTGVAEKINGALQTGKDIVLSPGMYYLSESLTIQADNQVILGLGLATLVAPVNGSPCVKVPTEKEGARIAGIMLEASKLENDSPGVVACFIEWGDEGVVDAGNANNPGVLTDIFARVGGSNLDRSVSTDVMIRIHSANVYGDNLWLWRADHVALIPANAGNASPEMPNFPPLAYHQTTLSEVPCKTGLEVNGDDVTIHGLAVEHTTGDQTIWNGKNGNVQFYQSELPYDVNNLVFSSPGYVGYKVTGEGHKAGGVGVYSNFRDYAVTVGTAITYPAESYPSNPFTNAFTTFLNGNGHILYVINGNLGSPSNASTKGTPQFVGKLNDT